MSWRAVRARAFGLLIAALVAGGIAAGVGASPAHAAGSLSYRWQRGYYLDNGWLCYGWASGAYHCTAHWHWSGGHLVSDNPSWVPNYGTSAPAATTRAAPASGSVTSLIQAAFGSYAWQAINVARCESGLNPNAYNPNDPGGSRGLFQFEAATWASTPYRGYSPYNAWANVQAAHWLFVRDGYSWRQWTCGRVILHYQ